MAFSSPVTIDTVIGDAVKSFPFQTFTDNGDQFHVHFFWLEIEVIESNGREIPLVEG